MTRTCDEVSGGEIPTITSTRSLGEVHNKTSSDPLQEHLAQGDLPAASRNYSGQRENNSWHGDTVLRKLNFMINGHDYQDDNIETFIKIT